MWYRFEEENPIGTLRVKSHILAWYDEDDRCFDEKFVPASDTDIKTLESIAMNLTALQPENEKGTFDKGRLFIQMEDGDEYELVLRRSN